VEYVERLRTRVFHPENGPSDGWLASFLKRHPELALRTPSFVDGGHFAMAKKSTIDKYFRMMESVFNDLAIRTSPHRIYNLDETGFNREPK
jgi:hypothetical protein